MSHEATAHLSRADKILGRLIKKVGPCGWKPDRRCSPFETLVNSVAHQQLNGTAAKTILGRFRALYPGKRFPSPEDLLATPDERLRGAGLSRAKVASIKDIAAKTISGVVPTSRAIARMEEEAILSQLTTIRGVGPWTVHMLLIFKLGRPDVLPLTDYGVRKGFALTYRLKELPTPTELLEHAEKWRPYRSFAAWYMWRALELE
jgi:3-methyladenine DNA glycosylase/8-oxoguanine DNA glycosylase